MKNIIGACICTASLFLVLTTFPGTIRHFTAQDNANDNDANKAIIMPSNKNLHNIKNKNDNKVDF